MKKYGFVYIWYDRKHKRYYIGCRWGNEDDGYVCSSPWMKRAYNKRPQDFRRRILTRVYSNKKDLLDEEYKWLSQIKVEELKTRYYNLHNHHFGHWSTDETTKKTIVEKRKETLKTSEVWKKFIESQKGKIVSETTKEKIRQKAIEQFSNPENRRKAGQANIGKQRRLGIPHSEESKRKMSKSRIGRIPWNKGKKTGKGQKEYRNE